MALNDRNEANAPQLSSWRQASISASIISCQLLQMIPFGAGIVSGLTIGEELGVSQAEATWIVASYPLTQGAFVLMGGRVGAVYGHKRTALAAGIWWTIFSLISGFMKNIITLSVMRALTGIGGAFMVPNIIALLTITFPPGRARNISVGLFGAMAPIGAAGGSVFPGFFVQLLPWKWLFFFFVRWHPFIALIIIANNRRAMLGAVVFIIFALIVPGEDEPFDRKGHIDYIGAYLGVGGLILFNFVWNQAPAVGWTEPYEYALLIVSILHFAAFVIWESKFASSPILPMKIFSVSSFRVMLVAAFFTFMGVGVVIWYVALWEQEIRHYSIFLTAATYVPLAIGGAIAAIASAMTVPYLAAQYIMAIGSLAATVCAILIATMPAHQTYWAQVFPGICVLAFAADFMFTASQIVASNTVKREQQGVAGSLIGTILSYGLSTGLGFAGTIEAYTNDRGQNPVAGYRHALYLAIGLAAAGGILGLLFVRIPKDTREGWGGDDDGAVKESSGHVDLGEDKKY